MIRVDFCRAASARRVMDETAVTPSESAIEAILIALTHELEAALEAAASAGADGLFEEIMARCRNGATLARAGQLLTAKSDRS